MKIGVMFGNPETTTGGNALKFYAAMRLDIRRVGAIKQGEQTVGNRTKVKVVKNKLAPPFREVEFDIMYGEGISKEGDLVDLGSEAGVIEKSGAWFGYGGERIGQGRENAKEFLRNHPEIAATIEAAILVKHGVQRIGVEQPTVPSAAAGAPAATTDAAPAASPRGKRGTTAGADARP